MNVSFGASGCLSSCLKWPLSYLSLTSVTNGGLFDLVNIWRWARLLLPSYRSPLGASYEELRGRPVKLPKGLLVGVSFGGLMPFHVAEQQQLVFLCVRLVCCP